LRRRKKEFGLYNILGMSKRNLARVLLLENLLVAALALVGGLGLGIVFSKLAELSLSRLLAVGPDFGFEISPAAIIS
ncbi:MAG: FtsX-like permease family protein, partial [Firmicutes bacterium]|nr:FtsX-like permease family protein [Bacillota bacterium]